MGDLTAIILAGGKSTRMGQDKALLSVDHMTLLQRTGLAAKTCAEVVYVVTPWIERYRELLPEGCILLQENSSPDSVDPHGPLVGFAQGLAQVETDWVLVLACDLPRLEAQVLQHGREQLPQVPDDAIAFLPRDAKGWQPLCGFYRHRCLPALNSFIQQGGRSFQQWLGQSQVEEWHDIDAAMLFNCNTPEDWAILHQRGAMSDAGGGRGHA